MSEITVGLMEERDLEAVHAIEVMCFQTPWSMNSLRREITENACARYVVLRDDGVTFAYAGMWFVLNEAHITNIAVHPDYRGKGFGEKVTRELIQLAADSGMTWMTLEVRKSNAAARNLYRKLGFTDIGCRKNYYENSEDAVLMSLEELPEGHPENDPFLVYE